MRHYKEQVIDRYIKRRRESQYKFIFSSLGEKKKEKITNIRKCEVEERFGRRDDEFCFTIRYQK